MNKTKDNTYLVLLVCLTSFALNSCNFSATAARGAMSMAREAHIEGDCKYALEKIGQARNYNVDHSIQVKAEMSYLEASCLEKMGREVEAISMYEFILKTIPPEIRFHYMSTMRLKKLKPDDQLKPDIKLITDDQLKTDNEFSE